MNTPFSNDPRITDYAMDAMDPQQRDAFEQEMAADPELAREVREAARLTTQLKALFAAETPGQLAPPRREAILDLAGKAPSDAHASALPLSTTATHPAGPRSWTSLALVLVPLLVAIAVLLVAARRADRPLADARLGVHDTSQSMPDDAKRASELAQLQTEVADDAFSMGPAPAGPVSEAKKNPSASAQPPVELHYNEFGSMAQKEHLYAAPGAAGPVADAPRASDESATPLAASMGMGEGMEMGMGGMGGGVPNRSRHMMLGAEVNSDSGRGLTEKLAETDRETVRYDDQAKAGYGAYNLESRLESAPTQWASAPGESKQITGEELPTLLLRDSRLGDQGRGPGMAGDQYEPIRDNPFQRVGEHPLSTFSIDVDTASYSKVRSYLQQNSLPRPDAVRIEELINYFDYDYESPQSTAEAAASEEEDQADADTPAPFKAAVEIASCPWTPEHRLARIGIKGREIENAQRPPSNLVFLLDVSGSMDQPNKLPLVKRGMQMLLDQLGENDRVAIVVYASATGLVLDSTPADQHATIFEALERLSAGGSTNGGDGIRLAYSVARDNFIEGGVNRVLLCTDGDFNVGTTGTDELVRLVEEESKGGIFVSVLGFGMGNHNDAMLEQISNKGNGNYAFIDTAAEAHKVFVKQTNSTLVTIAKDVKIQVEFNPQEVAAYRLIGYENRMLAKEDFNDDTKDAGEIGAGHTVTALYEVVPAGEAVEPIAPEVDDLRYQRGPRPTKHADSGELLTLKLRYKEPDGDTSKLIEFPVEDQGRSFGQASADFQFASAVASFGMQLRGSPYHGEWTMAAVEETAQSALGDDAHGLRAAFLQLVKKAAELKGEATAE